MNSPTWLYRRARDGAVEARIFDGDTLPNPADGWRDSPAKLPELAPDPFAEMSKAELEAYALERFGVDLDRRRTLKFLREQLRELAANTGEAEDDDDSA